MIIYLKKLAFFLLLNYKYLYLVLCLLPCDVIPKQSKLLICQFNLYSLYR